MEPPPTIDQQGLHELLFAAIEHIDSSFNIWMSGTFALLVTAHFVGTTLKKGIVYTLAFLYLGFSILYAGRIMWSGSMARKYTDAINQLTPSDFMEYAGLLRLVVFFVGTLATLYFLLRSSNTNAE